MPSHGTLLWSGTDDEDARAFLQNRLGLWAAWVCGLSSGFFLLNIVLIGVATVSPGLPQPDVELVNPANIMHLAANLLFGTVWIVARGRPLSGRLLGIVDGCAIIGGCTFYGFMAFFLTGLLPLIDRPEEGGLYAGLLASVNVVESRAIIVPSTPPRTASLSVAAMLPLVVLSMFARGAGAAFGVAGAIQVAAWCSVAIAIATLGSSVIFGLRREAASIRRLGQYTLEEKIGEGGMGIVYRASHALLRRPTAIKLLPPDRAGQANILRFEREVQMTAQLSHPNTVAIYDYGRTPDGVFYYVMEYLDGLNLEDLVTRFGPSPPGRVIHVLDQVCRSLAEAHGLGLIHRDIKPANIILTERAGEPDVAKVVDFGLVRRLETDGVETTLTSSNVLTGTPLYVPPEAITDPDLRDPRSDLYALGAVGYFLVAGVPVFEAATVVEVFAHHLHTDPEPPSRRTASPVPADLEQVILRCLRKRPEDRWSDAEALRLALHRCRDASSWTEEEARRWWLDYRRAPSHVARSTVPTSEHETVAVDVVARLADRQVPRS
ncbi:MAG TPA: serine/threonine-protein kinase [Vicinamibacterales bacterium]|nr:serine/threonine-protein kinase [Vicinamibacterales bacterium]